MPAAVQFISNAIRELGSPRWESTQDGQSIELREIQNCLKNIYSSESLNQEEKLEKVKALRVRLMHQDLTGFSIKTALPIWIALNFQIISILIL